MFISISYIIHYYWWTSSIKPRLLFSFAGYASWGLSLSSVYCIAKGYKAVTLSAAGYKAFVCVLLACPHFILRVCAANYNLFDLNPWQQQTHVVENMFAPRKMFMQTELWYRVSGFGSVLKNCRPKDYEFDPNLHQSDYKIEIYTGSTQDK